MPPPARRAVHPPPPPPPAPPSLCRPPHALAGRHTHSYVLEYSSTYVRTRELSGESAGKTVARNTAVRCGCCATWQTEPGDGKINTIFLSRRTHAPPVATPLMLTTRVARGVTTMVSCDQVHCTYSEYSCLSRSSCYALCEREIKLDSQSLL